MRPAKRQSLFTLLAALVRHQPIPLAAQAAATELKLKLPTINDTTTSPTNTPPGNQLLTSLDHLLTPVERALLASATTSAQLSARLTDLAALTDTERAARAATFNRIIFPLLLGTFFFFLLGFLCLPAIILWIFQHADMASLSSAWRVDGIATIVSWYRLAFLLFLATTGIVLLLLRRRATSLLARIPGTEKIFRTAQGALASQMLAAQLDVGIERPEALSTIQRTLRIPLSLNQTTHQTTKRTTDPLLRQLISGNTTAPDDCRDLHQLLTRRLQNTSAIRLTWLPPAIFWMIVAFFLSFGTFATVLDQLLW